MSKVIRNIGFNTLLSLSQILFPLITFPYASRILGPEGIGRVSFVDNLTQYFVMFAAVGIPLYGVRELAKIKMNSHDSSKFFSELIIIHVITTLIALTMFVISVFIFKATSENISLFLIGAGILISNLFIVEWFFQAQEKFVYITKRTILIRVVFVILMFLIVKDKSDVQNYYFLFLLIQLINACVNYSMVFKSGIKFQYKNLELRKHIKPLLFLTSCAILGSVYLLLDSVILGLLSNETTLGYYSAALRITKVPISLISALAIVLVPRVSNSFQDNDKVAISYYLHISIRYVLTFGIPLSFGMLLTGKWIVLLLSGPKFTPAVQLIGYLCPIIALIALNGVFFFQLFTPGRKEKVMIIILLAGALVSVGLNFLLIPNLNARGAAIATTCTELTVFLLCWYYSNKLFSISLKASYFIEPIVASVIFIPIVLMADQLLLSNLLKFLISIITCGAFYYIIQRFIFKNVIILRMEEFLSKIIRHE